MGVIVAVMIFTGCWDMNQATGEAGGGSPAPAGKGVGSEGGGS